MSTIQLIGNYKQAILLKATAIKIWFLSALKDPKKKGPVLKVSYVKMHL